MVGGRPCSSFEADRVWTPVVQDSLPIGLVESAEDQIVTWKLKRIEGTKITEIGTLPASMSVAEVEVVLQRLVCTRLTEQEVISASLRHEAGGQSSLLERVGGFDPMVFGHGGIQYSAEQETQTPKAPEDDTRPAKQSRSPSPWGRSS